jgi:hypothetical protein
MMISALSAAALLALAGSDPDAAPQPRPTPTANPASSASRAPPAGPLYCVVSTRTGSRIRQKECRTRTDWMQLTGIDPAEEVGK